MRDLINLIENVIPFGQRFDGFDATPTEGRGFLSLDGNWVMVAEPHDQWRLQTQDGGVKADRTMATKDARAFIHDYAQRRRRRTNIIAARSGSLIPFDLGDDLTWHWDAHADKLSRS